MKFVNKSGLTSKVRRFAGSGQVSSDDVLDPHNLGRQLTRIFERLLALEIRLGPEASEFEIDVSTGGALVSIQHDFQSPVRWYVTDWTGGSAGPSLVRSITSTNRILVLASYVAGTAIVRVEPSQS